MDVRLWDKNSWILEMQDENTKRKPLIDHFTPQNKTWMWNIFDQLFLEKNFNIPLHEPIL